MIDPPADKLLEKKPLLSSFRWLAPRDARRIRKSRQALLEQMRPGLRFYAEKAKISTGKLPYGCSLCVQGRWSCLFINGRCNASCFYCPQDRSIRQERQPFSQEGLNFTRADDYAAFVRKFAFKGVSFSGGEALLAFEKLLNFIRALRKGCRRDLYIWLYTNGKAADRGKLLALRRLGVDEIRFNISADNYDLTAAKLAAKIMDTVGIEIPAVPEDYFTLARLLPAIQAAGIKFINLHQLSTTRYNYKKFLARGYTFLNQPRLPVAESEITALELMREALNNGLKVPLHYCSCSYQCNFQAAARRARAASFLKSPQEEITSAGFIRNLSLLGDRESAEKIALKLKSSRRPFRLERCGAKTRLELNPEAFKKLKLDPDKSILTYFAAGFCQSAPGVKKIRAGAREFFLEKKAAARYRGRISGPEKWEKITAGLGPVR